MHTFDIVFLIVIAYGVWKGWTRGSGKSVLGAIFGFIKYLLVLSVIVNTLSRTGLVSEKAEQESVLYQPIKATLGFAIDLAKDVWEKGNGTGDTERANS